MHGHCSHILREGNVVADALASNGQNLPCFGSQWWDEAPSFLGPLLDRDSLGLPFYRAASWFCFN